MMTQIEMDVAHSAVRKNKAVAEYFERQNAIYNCIDWEQRRYEIAKDTLQGILNGFTATKEDIEDNSEPLAKCAVYLADALIAELKKEPKK